MEPNQVFQTAISVLLTAVVGAVGYVLALLHSCDKRIQVHTSELKALHALFEERDRRLVQDLNGLGSRANQEMTRMFARIETVSTSITELDSAVRLLGERLSGATVTRLEHLEKKVVGIDEMKAESTILRFFVQDWLRSQRPTS